MWRRVISVLVIWTHVSSHPTDNVGRLTRIINGREVECCPCPPRSQTLPPRSADCPCRDADSDGASSLFLPRVLQPLRSTNDADTSEDSKPLLHPEVGLASSMLETLREVTEEEYQDAVARDAARNSAGNSLPETSNLRDSNPDTSNLVTILINPGSSQNVVSEASQAQESRRALGKAKTSLILPKKKLLKNIFDMDNGASTVQEKVAGINKGLDGLKLRTSKFNLFPKINHTLKVVDKEPGLFSLSQSKGADEERPESDLVLPKIPNFRLANPLKKIREHVRPINLGKRLGGHENTMSNARSDEDDGMSLDNGPLPSNQEDQFTITPARKHQPLLGIHSLLRKGDPLVKKPLTLNTLWKLKDVELIKPKPIETKINIPSLKLPPHISKSSLEKSSFKPKYIDCNAKTREDNIESNIQVIPKSNTNILDAMPSPSDNHINIVENINDIETTTIAFDKINVDPTITNSSEPDLSLDSEEVVAENAHHLQAVTFTEKPANSKTPQEALDYDETVENTDSGIVIDTRDYDDVPQVPLDNINIFDQDDFTSDVSENPEFSFDIVDNQDQSFLPSIGDDTEIDIVSDDPQIPEELPVSIDFNPFDDSDTGASNDFAQIAEQSNEEDFSNIQTDAFFRSAEPTVQETGHKLNNDVPEHASQLERSEEAISSSNQMIHDQNDDLLDMNLDSQSSVENESETIEKKDQISMKELQQISDSLLDASETKAVQDNSVSNENQCMINEQTSGKVQNTNLDENTIRDSNEVAEIPDIASEATNQEDGIIETTPANLFAKEDDIIINNSAPDHEETVQSCSSNDSTNMAIGKDVQDTKNVILKSKEMATGASAQVPYTVSSARSPLLPFSPLSPSIFQPSPFEGSNLFGGNNFPLIPINRNLINIPGIESINPRLSDILGLKSRNSDSPAFEDANDCADATAKLSDASADSQTFLPSFSPLENLDLDILQINPFNKNNALSARMPTLNLNTFKTHLKLPTSLDLRPVKLQSSFGNNRDGLLGATLTFGPDKLETSKKGKSSGSFGKSKLTSTFSEPTNILGASLPTLPSLEEIRDTMRSNAENLLSSPLTSSLRSSPIGSLSDDLRTHTENTVRNIQNSFASTLNEVRKDPKYAQPEGLLERFSTAREDFGDKLQAIHMDLTDRLTTMHDRLFDKARLSSIPLPLSMDNNLNSKSSNLQSSEPTGKFKIHKHSKAAKPKTSSNAHNTQNKIKPFKISKAASSLSTKSVNVPKLVSVSTEPTFTRPLQDTNIIKNIRAKSEAETQHRGTFNKHLVDNNRSKLSVSNTNRQNIGHKAPNQLNSNFRPISSLHSRYNINSDSRGFASEPKPIVVQPKTFKKIHTDSQSQLHRPVPTIKPHTETNKRVNIDNMERSNQRPVIKPSNKSYIPMIIPKRVKTSSSNNLARTSSLSQLKPPSITPKSVPSKLTPAVTKIPSIQPTENPLLVKLREALKARFPNLNPKLTLTKSIIEPTQKADDMLRAASDYNQVIAEDAPLKENVSYRCRMVCVKEPIENK